ncbi:sigma-70 family RNA polymerase sigma factor [Herbivorax sp. ANBcel31]|uniref:RNA polymerase sigma factor n=1 Tax=Herbivorax sp. ANBcel31 TaxID=3069754 RepID=UPI0027B0CD29|nr:sigma-70 family RNA polymerase sigma factor [Herbivorax sp. ANBcel31]MDQ2086109.1 sigma-70 family RNA polymerase sigma factor [Herbivorax sp. ANBcel31]
MEITDFQDAGCFDKRNKLLNLIDIHKNQIYKLCCQLTNNRFDAEDLFQDIWVRVVRNLDCYNENKSFDTWLYTITINLYRDRYRKQKRWLNIIKDFFTNEKKESVFSNVPESKFHPETHLIDEESTKELEKFVSGLPDTYRIPIILYYYKEMNYNQISRVLDIPLGTVKSRLNRGIRKLKELMEKGGYSYES